MALNDIELHKIKKELSAFVERRRPRPHIRPRLDIGYRITGQSIFILEIRPQWNNPKVIREHPIAKATYVRTQDKWKIYWMRANLKWQGYEPTPEVEALSSFIRVVDEDQYHCFWG